MVNFIDTAIQYELRMKLGIDIYDVDPSTNTLMVKVDKQVEPGLTSKQKVDTAKELLNEFGVPVMNIKFKTVEPKIPAAVRKQQMRRR